MALANLRTRDQIVSAEMAAIQAAGGDAFSFQVGSVIRALVEAHARTAVWEESLIQQVLATTRLATSSGSDVDSFVNDFGYTRPAGTQSSGTVTFGSFSSSSVRYIPAQNPDGTGGATVSYQDGSLSFTVIPDLNNFSYSQPDNAYVMPLGVPTVDVPVKANSPGIIGNAAPNTIIVINSPITGVDTVTNNNTFTNGVDPASDAAVRSGFVLYLQGIKRAALDALNYAVSIVPGVTDWIIVENVDYTSNLQRLGYFYVVVNDGTGAPPSPLITAVANSIEVYRGFTIAYEVHGPTPVTANVSATVTMPHGYTNPNLQSTIVTALDKFIDSMSLGETLFYSLLGPTIYNAILSLEPVLINQFNITNVLLNSGTSDLTITKKQAIVPGTITITLIPT